MLAQRVPTSTPSTGGNNDNANEPTAAAFAGASAGKFTGAIVGGVVGGVAALALIAVVAWWLIRRRRRAAAAATAPTSHTTENYSYSGLTKASDAAPSEFHSSARPPELAPDGVYQLPADPQAHQLPSDNRIYYEMPGR